MIQHHNTDLIDDIPCDYKSYGDLRIPTSTKQGEAKTKKNTCMTFSPKV